MDMLQNAERAIEFVGDMRYSEFENDLKTQYAVVRTIEIIGEASKKVPSEIKKAFPDIPWREIAGTRDKTDSCVLWSEFASSMEYSKGGFTQAY